MLIDIITRMAEDTGLDLVDQRSLLLRHANNGAGEVYRQLECNAICREVSLLIPADMIVSLPSYIGELRGMRIHTNDIPFDLATMGSPRYISNTWQYKWRNWRDLGESPIKRSLTSVAPFTITCPAVETDLVTVLVSGQTANALREQESIELDTTVKTTAKSFGPAVYSIACSAPRTSDITVTDSDGNVIAVLYNTDNRTRYKIVDVSQMPWPLDTASSETIVDVMYKHPLYKFVNDSDQFPAGDIYDDAIYHMAMHLFYKPMQGKETESSKSRAQAEAALITAKGSSESQQVKKFSFGRNKFFGLFRRLNYFPGSISNVDTNVNQP